MSFEVAAHILPLRERVLRFVEEEVYPAEHDLDNAPPDQSQALMRSLMQRAKDASLWALGHPQDIGGQGLPFLDYVYINEVVGRSEHAMVALGTHSLQDSIMLHLYANET